MAALTRASGLRGYPSLMRAMGFDPVPLLARHHIAEASLDGSDVMVPLRAVAHLLEASAEATGCGDFGLRLSRCQTIDLLGPLAIAALNAPTVGDGLAYVMRHLFVYSPGLVATLNESAPILENTIEVSFELRLPAHVVTRQTIDHCLANAHNFIRLGAGDSYDLRAVSIPHEPVVKRSVYERFFGVRVLREAATATLHISRATFATEVKGANGMLRQIAEDYIFRNFGDAGNTVSDRVRRVLRQTLGESSSDKSTVASLLVLHPRTLQRRLAEEGTSFENIKEGVRKDLALHFLRETKLTIGRVSMMLGFPTQSSLSRACREWFGLTPSDIRSGNHQKLRQSDSVADG
ncbi:AraC family transcriptional regulator [Paraburkholderia ferrariae]|uniref:AraC family transcriptional regulator ligand-binding domain-containing protein n=1 Tax=Paraburkholderia ferrariae TaxID=386056 RepID=A0ABU9RNT7_9BURK